MNGKTLDPPCGARLLQALLTASAIVFGCACGIAQVTFYDVPGELSGDEYGYSVAMIRDLDGDGFDEIVVGAPGYSNDKGKVQVLSGATRQLLFQFIGAQDNDRLGTSCLALGDIDGDGLSDVACGAPSAGPGGTVTLISGIDGSLIQTLNAPSGNVENFGWTLAAPGDLNSDLIPDLLVGAPAADVGGGQGAGAVHVVSGADRSILYSVGGPFVGNQLGFSLGTGADVDGDNVMDFVSGAPYGGSLVRLYSGVDGQVLFTFSSGGLHGWEASLIPDWNADSVWDVAVAEPNHDARSGRVKIFSGRTAALLTILEPSNPTTDLNFGHRIVATGDYDKDGRQDLLVLGPNTRDRRSILTCFSTGSGSIIWQATIEDAEDVTASRDVNGNGVPDVLVGRPHQSQQVTGSVRVMGHCTAVQDVYGSGCFGTGERVPALDVEGCASVGLDFSLRVSNGRGAASGAVFLGFAGPADIPAFGCRLLVNPPHLLIPVTLDGLEGLAGAGSATLPAAIPWSQSFLGLRLNAQAILLDFAGPFGVSMSNGLEIEVR